MRLAEIHPVTRAVVIITHRLAAIHAHHFLVPLVWRVGRDQPVLPDTLGSTITINTNGDLGAAHPFAQAEGLVA